MALTNYVKFLRGTTSAYQAKVDNAQIDEDALYFVYQSKDSDCGQLYLGSKLLSGAKGEIANSSIGDFKDVILEAVGDKQIITYDEEAGVWVNSSIAEIIGLMVGASATIKGASGLVPAPKAGEQNKFLRGDGTWAAISAESAPSSSIGDVSQLIDTRSEEEKEADNNENITVVQAINNLYHMLEWGEI